MVLSIAATLPMLVAVRPTASRDNDARADAGRACRGGAGRPSASMASSPIRSRCARSSRSTSWAAAFSSCSASSRARARRRDCRPIPCRRRWSSPASSSPSRPGARGRVGVAAFRGNRPGDIRPRCAGANLRRRSRWPMMAMVRSPSRRRRAGSLLRACRSSCPPSACCCRFSSAGGMPNGSRLALMPVGLGLSFAVAIACLVWRSGQPLVYIARRLCAAARHRARAPTDSRP